MTSKVPNFELEKSVVQKSIVGVDDAVDVGVVMKGVSDAESIRVLEAIANTGSTLVSC